MNYLQNIKHYYDNVGFEGYPSGVVYSDSGEVYLVDFNNKTNYNIVECANECAQKLQDEDDDGHMVMFGLSTQYATMLFFNLDIDFVTLVNNANDVYDNSLMSPDISNLSATSAKPFNSAFVGDSAVVVGIQLMDYYQYQGDNNNYYLVGYEQGETYVIDFSSMAVNKYTNSQNLKYFTCQTNGQSYYAFYLDMQASYGWTIGYGTPYTDIYDNAFAIGQRAGNSYGYQQGYQNGFNDGQTMSGVSPTTATAFTYIGGAFNAVSGILALEIIPHVTLGLCFSIPLVLILIMTIFKLVKK